MYRLDNGTKIIVALIFLMFAINLIVGSQKMKGLNPELSAKIASEVALKKLIDNANDLVERRLPTTRASIEQFAYDRRLKEMLDLDVCQLLPGIKIGS